MTATALREKLYALADAERAVQLQRYFKTGPGEYAEGDRFLGLRVPQIRRLAKAHDNLTLAEMHTLLDSPIHEERLLALLLMVRRFERGDERQRREIYRCYLESTDRINNWDLVDLSARQIVGGWLAGRSRKPLYRLARSRSLWERRIAVLATFHFIDSCDYADALQIAEILLNDTHDLIHKAVGWMLREVGKRDPEVEEAFLQQHYRVMPRTMLRYAIERFPERRRQAYLKGRV